MTLAQALGLVHQQKEKIQKRKFFLVCGFQPLHLATFLQAHLGSIDPEHAADIQTGVYGDLEGALAKAAESACDAASVVIEWSDLDPRLGLRSAGGWALSVQQDIVESCQERLTRLLVGLQTLAARMPVAVVAPTLPLTLFGHTAGWQSSPDELKLHQQLAAFLARAAEISRVSVLSPASLARVSPESSRLDAAMELRAGFPYTIGHASAVAEHVVKLLFPPGPKKGLITDLDETFWSGIVGEVGVQGVSWSLAEHSQIHGLYQQMLRHLSEMGVLLAVVSKNNLAVVEEALRRDDLHLPAASLFPICANWGPKSAGVAEVLRVWNIGAESVVFVDDSPMELDEVRAAFPAMTCLRFQARQPAKVLELLEQLRDLFGKPSIGREDALRQSSIRANAEVQAAAGSSANGEFIRGLQGRLTFDCRKDPANKRVLELINKTNQFNLNGIRLSEAEWLRHLEDESAVVLAVSYEDRFGPLGTIGVLCGRHSGGAFDVTSWVLSCRAFSRKIEYHMLDYLFSQCHVPVARLAFRRTDRNQPLQECLTSFGLELVGDAELLLSPEKVRNCIESLPHEVRAA